MNDELVETRPCQRCGGRGWTYSALNSTDNCRHCGATGVVHMAHSDALARDAKDKAFQQSLGVKVLTGLMYLVVGILVLMSTFVFGPWWLIAIIVWIVTDR